jgi:formate hydrogenlyase transcriptional activator
MSASKLEASSSEVVVGRPDAVEAVPPSSAAEDRLRLLIDAVPTLIWTALPDGAVDFINRRGLEYHGLSLENAQGWGWTAAVHPDDLTDFLDAWRAAVAKGTAFQAEARLRKSDGVYRWFLSRGMPLRDELANAVRWYGTTTDIEDLKRAEEALQRSEELLRLVIDTTPALIHTGRPDGSLDFFNQRWLTYLGVPLEGVCGWSWTNSIHPEDVDDLVHKWQVATATGGSLEAEARVRRADGKYRWFLHRKVPLRDVEGRIVKWYGTSVDIEDRKKAEEALRRSEFYLAEGQRISHAGGWAFNDNGFDYWSSELFQVHGLDPSGKPPTMEEYLHLVHPEDRGFMERAIHKVLADHRGFDFTKRIVRPDGKIRHVRCVGVPVTEGATFQGFVGTAMDVTEHEEMTQELKRREAYLAEAQRLSHTGSFGWKPDTGEIVWSDETYRIFEYNAAEKPTLNMVFQRIHPQDRALAQQVIEDASKCGTDFEQEYRLVMPSGAIKNVHVRAHALHGSSGNIEFVGAVTDITERKTAEEDLRSSEAYLAEAQRLSHTGSWAWSPDQDTRYWSEECYRVLGFDPRGGVPRTEEFIQRIHPDDQQAFRESAQKATHTKLDEEVDYRIVHPDGAVRDIHSIGHPVFSPSGDLIEYTGTVIDITERKKAEEKIRQQEMELRQMLDLAPQQVAVFGSGGERLYANRIGLDYIGLSLEEWRQTPGSLLHSSRFIHPDDRERAACAYSDSTRSSGSAYELELRVRGADGNYRWFLARYNPLHDDKGQVKRWYVALTDIEDRKRAEERLQHENVALREEVDKASMFEEIVGASPALRAVLSGVAKVGPTDSTVLITGETGTGKELIARAIHKQSPRSSRAFVSVNCAAIPQNLIASELFGHEKGAFTGALQRRAGRFEMAERGTIFLDEVGDLPAETQIALLRVLQEREFERVGGNQTIRADVRVIAATNRDLQAAVEGGRFRNDLFYRLNVFPIHIPPLRERKEDIPILVEYFIGRYAAKSGKKIRSVKKKTLDLMQSYPWPGNIRELQNVIERSVIVCEAETLLVDESWLSHGTASAQDKGLSSGASASLPLSKRSMVEEKRIIETALAEARGRVSGSSGAATRLGVPASTLESKIRALKINKHRFRTP